MARNHVRRQPVRGNGGVSTELTHKLRPQGGDRNLPGHPGPLRCVSRVQDASLRTLPPPPTKPMLIYQVIPANGLRSH